MALFNKPHAADVHILTSSPGVVVKFYRHRRSVLSVDAADDLIVTRMIKFQLSDPI